MDRAPLEVRLAAKPQDTSDAATRSETFDDLPPPPAFELSAAVAGVDRRKLIAATCVLAILTGFAVTQAYSNPEKGLEKSLFVWGAFVLACGLLLKFPTSGRYQDALNDGLPAGVALSITILLKFMVIAVLDGLAQSSVAQNASPLPAPSPAHISGQPLALLMMTALGLGLLTAFIGAISMATAATIGIVSLASEVIVAGFQKVISIKPQSISTLTKVIKATTALLCAAVALWAIIS